LPQTLTSEERDVSEKKGTRYWKLEKEELLREFDVRETGLDEAEATRRLRTYGLNEIPHAGHRTGIDILFSQLKSPLIYVLVFASALASFLGDTTEAIIILAIMLVNTMMGFGQEYRSERAVDELKKYLSYTTIVLRNGRKHTISTAKLVPGDIVSLSIGDVVPAEVRLLEASQLQTDESTLTGESVPVNKTTNPIDVDSLAPHQLSNMALMGSTVTNGSGVGLVVATGRKTFFGRTASSLAKQLPITDFQRNLSKLGNFIVRLVLLSTTFVFVVYSLEGHGVLESLIFSLALTVGIMPEALPVIITVGLSDGALRLAKKKVIVKKLEATEDIGNVDVFCTDKTGTLTQNEIRVEDIVDPQGHSSPKLIKYAVMCNSAVVEGSKILGNPIDVAIWKRAREEEFDDAVLTDFGCIHEIPFQFNRRRMSTVVNSGGRRLLVSKGAPESILQISTNVSIGVETRPISQEQNEVNSLIEKYSQGGYRLIALAYKEIEDKSVYSVGDEFGLTFIGLVVLDDPPKEDAPNAISKLKSLNIRLKILSGDDPVVTASVCHKIGVDGQGKILTGMDVEHLEESELRKAAEENDVFGRVTPDQKFAIVDALKKNGHTVGYLGDGVNDAPALKLADAGVSVDSGAQVAKEASSIILLEKSLGVISDGVVEGRKAFGNMVKYIMNTISANFSNMFTIAVCSLFLPFLPLLPSQILLINLLSDAPLIAISTDNLDEETLKAPKRLSMGLLARFSVFFGVISSIFDFIMIISLVYVLNVGPVLFRTVWAIESVLHEIIVTFSIRTRRKFYESRPSTPLAAASAIFAVVTLAIIYLPIGAAFEFVNPPLWSLVLISGILTSYFFLVEGVKHLFFHHYSD
jgi:Mg2+-importing ATPase